jgi:hypothetical protein
VAVPNNTLLSYTFTTEPVSAVTVIVGDVLLVGLVTAATTGPAGAAVSYDTVTVLDAAALLLPAASANRLVFTLIDALPALVAAVGVNVAV